MILIYYKPKWSTYYLIKPFFIQTKISIPISGFVICFVHEHVKVHTLLSNDTKLKEKPSEIIVI